MSRRYYKAVRMDGRSFHDKLFAWDINPGAVTRHPSPVQGSDPARYLSVSTTPDGVTGASWPLRLFEVTPVGRTWTPDPVLMPCKRAGEAFRTGRELPAHLALGPAGTAILGLRTPSRSFSAADRHLAYVADSVLRGEGPGAWVGAERVALDYHLRGADALAKATLRSEGTQRADVLMPFLRALIRRHLLPREDYAVIAAAWEWLTGSLLHPEDHVYLTPSQWEAGRTWANTELRRFSESMRQR